MSMVPLDFSFYNLTLECLKDGSIPRSRIDDAVSRILRVKYALGNKKFFTSPNENCDRQFSFASFIHWKKRMAR